MKIKKAIKKLVKSCKKIIPGVNSASLDEQIKMTALKNMLGPIADKTNSNGEPNINALWLIVKDIDAIKLNIKNFGYQLAREFDGNLKIEAPNEPVNNVDITCRSSKQDQIETDWYRYWCKQLHLAPIYHRKPWEFAFCLQSLHDLGMLKTGKKGIGFGCGEEPLPAYFASLGIDITVTDLHPDVVAGMGWAETGQHTSSLEKTKAPHLCSDIMFDKHVSLEYVDMNNIPNNLNDYDFCWSICAYEHLGSIENGLKFVENSLNVLKPGGVAIHTTEFNYLETDKTVDNWPTVLFLRKHFEELASRLKSKGHHVFPLDFSVGSGVLDRYIDIPPYSIDDGLNKEQWKYDSRLPSGVNLDPVQLKLTVDGFATTCFGFIAQKSD